jgi:ADP-ribose pyrophosphatase
MADRLLSSRVLFKGHAFNVRRDEVVQPSGRKAAREIVDRANAIAVVALDKDGNILLERQWRQATAKVLLEIPAGGIEPGEEPVGAVSREMQEETGYLPRKIESLGGFYLAPGYSTEYLHVFLATDLVPSRLTAEDTDEIELVPTPPRDILRLIADGTLEDGKSIAGLLLYLSRK